MSVSRVLVDSSVWIDHFRANTTRETASLNGLLREDTALLGDLILLEVLQGFLTDRLFQIGKDQLLIVPLVDLGGEQMAIAAAENYRFLRSKGITVRKTIDMLIGTYCIANKIALLHTDRDFDPLEQHLGLRVYRGL